MNAKEGIKKLQEQLDKLKAELDKPKLEVGTYIYVIRAETGARGADGMLGKIIPKTDKITNGIDGRDSLKIQTITGSTWGIGENPEISKATPTEIETALIKEAKRRGFKVGATLNNTCLYDDDYNFTDHKVEYERELSYNADKDELDFKKNPYRYLIYKEGKWAEIVQDKVTFFDWDVDYTESAVRIGNTSYPKRWLRNTKELLDSLMGDDLDFYNISEVLTEIEKLDLD